MGLKILLMTLGILGLKRQNKKYDRVADGFSIVEVVVAIAVFSTAISIVFMSLTQTQRIKKVGKNYSYAVLLADNFLNERKLKRDGSSYFFKKDDLTEIVKGNVQEGDYQGRMVAFTNKHVLYSINCTSSVLFTQPLCYRGLVKCSWVSLNFNQTNSGSFEVATVFVMSNYAAK